MGKKSFFKIVNAAGIEITATPEAAKEMKLVAKVVKLDNKLRKDPKEQWEAFVAKEVIPFALGQAERLGIIAAASELGPNGKKVSKSFKGADGETVTVSFKTTVTLDTQLMEKAFGLIEEELRVEINAEGELPEVLQMLLTGMRTAKGYRITPAFFTFQQFKPPSKRLQDAQELFRNAVGAKDSNYYVEVRLPAGHPLARKAVEGDAA